MFGQPIFLPTRQQIERNKTFYFTFWIFWREIYIFALSVTKRPLRHKYNQQNENIENRRPSC